MLTLNFTHQHKSTHPLDTLVLKKFYQFLYVKRKKVFNIFNRK